MPSDVTPLLRRRSCCTTRLQMDRGRCIMGGHVEPHSAHCPPATGNPGQRRSDRAGRASPWGPSCGCAPPGIPHQRPAPPPCRARLLGAPRVGNGRRLGTTCFNDCPTRDGSPGSSPNRPDDPMSRPAFDRPTFWSSAARPKGCRRRCSKPIPIDACGSRCGRRPGASISWSAWGSSPTRRGGSSGQTGNRECDRSPNTFHRWPLPGPAALQDHDQDDRPNRRRDQQAHEPEAGMVPLPAQAAAPPESPISWHACRKPNNVLVPPFPDPPDQQAAMALRDRSRQSGSCPGRRTLVLTITLIQVPPKNHPPGVGIIVSSRAYGPVEAGRDAYQWAEQQRREAIARQVETEAAVVRDHSPAGYRAYQPSLPVVPTWGGRWNRVPWSPFPRGPRWSPLRQLILPRDEHRRSEGVLTRCGGRSGLASRSASRPTVTHQTEGPLSPHPHNARCSSERVLHHDLGWSNRQKSRSARLPLDHFRNHVRIAEPADMRIASVRSTCQANDAGWSSPVAREAHNLEVPGSNPGPAT